LILRKNATRCQILRLNARNSISAGATPRPRWGSLQRSPDFLAVFKGRKKERKEMARRGGRGEGKGGGREGRGRREARPPNILA